MAVAVLVGLSLSTWFTGGIFFQGGGGSELSNSANKVREVRSSGVATAASRKSPDEAQGSTATLTEKTGAPASETTEGAGASSDNEPTRNAQDKPTPEDPPKASTESLHVLVLGVDRRPDDPEGSQTHSDTMMLIKVSPQTGSVELLSVPRDLLVEVMPGVEDRINNAYAYGGIGQAKSVMENLTGIPIDRYAIVDFEGFKEVVDALGGITLEVEQPVRVGIEGHRVYIPTGTQELDGLEALAFARYRGTPCGDLDRIERQQQLVSALRAQALEWNTITQLPKIVKIMNENIDTDLGIVQAISLGRTLIRYGADGDLSSAQLKGKPETLPNGDAVLIPDAQANESILEDFRDDDPNVRRSDREPQPEGSSTEC
jgi:LCP family protein required for cell wall assembly